jgi:hypothetical protein
MRFALVAGSRLESEALFGVFFFVPLGFLQ